MLTRGVVRLLSAAMVAVLLLSAAPALAAPDIMPVSEIRQGMTGIGKTVVSGTSVEEFNVEVLGVMKNKGPAGDLILVRTSGPLIDRTGGIAEGMSGSPVYIDGKLVGAIAYGWSQADHHIGMVTPIGDMLRLWQPPATYNQAQTVANQAQSVTSQAQAAAAAALGAKPLATPVMAAGFSPQAITRLAGQFKTLNLPLTPYDAGSIDGGIAGDDNAVVSQLVPGSAIGVELMRGDLSLGALGTLTYRDEDKILAFGHPFLQRGKTGYFLTNAYVYTTVTSADNPFKVGTTGALLGSVTQDRNAGLAGEIGRYPSIIPVRVRVIDKDLGQVKDTDVQIINDPILAPALASTAAFSAMEKAMDRIGGGTAKVSFTIMGSGLPEDLQRDNMFYSAGNVADVAVSELGDALDMLLNNKFRGVDIIDVAVRVETSQERRTAAIVSATADKQTVHPGDTVNINVQLQPYRGEASERTVTVTIPQDQAAGALTIDVHGGGMLPVADVLLAEQGLQDILNPKPDKSFDDVLKDFNDRDRNNDIVAEITSGDQFGDLYGTTLFTPLPTAAAKTEPDKKKPGKLPPAGLADKTEQKNKEKDHKFHLTTDYIIEGDTQVTVTVQP